MTDIESPKSQFLVYQTEDGQPQIDVRLENESVWLTQSDLGELFQVKPQNITMHLKNIFRAGELDEETTCKEFLQVRVEGNRSVKRKRKFYNLDAIISVGYRIQSRIATRFRIWATQTLKQHLVDGYTLNKQRLESFGTDVEGLVDLVQKTLTSKSLVDQEGLDLTRLIGEYARSWTLIQAYDEQTLMDLDLRPHVPSSLTEEMAVPAIQNLKRELIGRQEATNLFGNIRTNGLASALGAIEQTFDGQPLYPSVISRAAHLLYFIIKNHPFTDGNKRIGSFLFLMYLEKNRETLSKENFSRIGDTTMVPLALLIAESDPRQKELIIRLIQHLLIKSE